MNSHVRPESSIRGFKRHSNIFHHDTVTARAISRLSQAVARMTANDTAGTSANGFEDTHRKGFTPSSSLTQLSVQTVCLNDTSSTFGLFTQRSSLPRAASPLPLLTTGSKRSYSYVVGHSRPLDRHFPFPSALSSSSHRLSNLNRFHQHQPIICDDATSSDTSMLSITPPRSEPSVGSSADLSSCADESHPTTLHSSFRQKRRRKRRKDGHNSHSTGLAGDCRWNRWRISNPPIDDDERVHRTSKRIDILDIDDEDSSEEGPIKKARVTEKVLEIPPSFHSHDRCKCNNHRLRRTASLSPKRPHHHFVETHEGGEALSSRKLRKPTKFRKSLLNSRQSTPLISHSAHCDSMPHDNQFEEFSSSQPLDGISDEDADGDDECSDATSPQK